MRLQRSDRGFTLIELLVVISILGILVAFLIPTITSGRLVAAKTATTDTIKRIGLGLEVYKNDFGEYPPSRPQWSPLNGSTTAEQEADKKKRGTMYRGAANLVWYLAGPGGNGWGIDAAGRIPYDGRGVTGSTLYTAPYIAPQRSYGPYFKATPETVAYEDASGSPTPGATPVMGAFVDSFKPAGKILYFRYEANPQIVASTVKPNYQVTDNNYKLTGSEEIGDSKGLTNYGSQTYFFQTIKILVTTDVYRYVRDDYLLVSPGPDGFYGWVKVDETGAKTPWSKDDKTVVVGNDDIVNW